MKVFAAFLVGLFVSTALLTVTAWPQTDAGWRIHTIAGTGKPGRGGDGGRAVEAQLSFPTGIAVDKAGNLYIADSFSHHIRRVDTTGTITTVAGIGEPSYGGDGGPAVRAQLSFPSGVAADHAGNLYISDPGNNRIRRVDADGTIATIAGTGERGYDFHGPAVEARLDKPSGVVVDEAGNLYIVGLYNFGIRRVDATGTMIEVAGSALPLYERENEQPFSRDRGLAVDDSGNLIISNIDYNYVRRVDATGTVSLVAGTREPGFGGDGGPAVEAQLNYPEGLAVDKAGDLYIADSGNHRIRRVGTSGTITTIAGTGEPGYAGDGGLAHEAQLDSPIALVMDGAGNLYVADLGNYRIRVLTRAPPLSSPTELTATLVSYNGVDLAWEDNSEGETGFRLQRRVDGSTDWVEIGTAAANATGFSDSGLEPATTYLYRVRAFNIIQSSAFSNPVRVRTLQVQPPTLTRFSPTRGPVGTQVTLTGTHLFEATAVRFNGIDASGFEVVSGASIEAVVPQEATSGPISVVTPGGTTVSADLFTVTEEGTGSQLFVPVLLTSAGRNNAFFTSELTLTNRGAEEATLRYTYTADAGGGSGTTTDSLAPGLQIIKPNAIDYLTDLGIPIPGSGNRIGTLRVEVSGSSQVSVVTRTTTAVPDGRAGLAYPGIAQDQGFQEAVYLCGLRQNRQDRSNVAFQHMGSPGDGPITLRTTVFSGEADDTRPRVVGEVELQPGGFHQYSGLLGRLGRPAQGYVKVEKLEGEAPFYAYGVINDNFNSDGSFVFPLAESSLVGTSGQTLPVIIETGNFQSELTVTNFSASEKTVDFSFVADAVQTGDDTAEFRLTLKAGQQLVLPDIVEDLRRREVAGIGRANRAFVGALFARPAEGGHERDRDRSPDGLSGQGWGAIQPLLQRGALWLGFGRERLDLRTAAERREPQQPGPGQHG